MIVEFEINGARVIISGDNLSVNVTEDSPALRVQSDALPSGKQIRAFRSNLGLNQAGFAKLLGVSRPSTICRWEQGVGHPSGASAIALVRLMAGSAS